MHNFIGNNKHSTGQNISARTGSQYNVQAFDNGFFQSEIRRVSYAVRMVVVSLLPRAEIGQMTIVTHPSFKKLEY